MEREVGGGIGMGNTCKPMAVSFQCMTKFTTNKKKRFKGKTKSKLASSELGYLVEISKQSTEDRAWFLLSVYD